MPYSHGEVLPKKQCTFNSLVYLYDSPSIPNINRGILTEYFFCVFFVFLRFSLESINSMFYVKLDGLPISVFQMKRL